MKQFSDLVVVERAGSIAGAYCAKLFADHGAEVTLVGSPMQARAEAGYLHQGKGRAVSVSHDLASRADLVIESSAHGPLEPRTGLDDTIVLVQLSPYGSHGPYASWASSDLVDYAVSGHSYLYGDPDREPLRGPPNQPAYASGLYGFVGAMVALLSRERSGAGQVVEVSHLDVMVALHQFTLLRYTLGNDVLRRMGNRCAGQGYPNGIYPCADGWISIAAPGGDQVERLLAASGLYHLLERPEIESPMDFQAKPGVLDEALIPWLAEQSVAEVVELLQALRVPSAPTTTMSQVLTDPQLAHRGYWTESDDGHRVPGRPFRLSRHRWRGSSSADDAASPPAGGRRVSTWADTAGDPERDGPLAGLRVLDLSRVWAGPLATRILADLGADVIWVEAPWARGPRALPKWLVEATKYYPDNDAGDCQWNRNGHIVKYSIGKRSLAIDLDAPAGVGAFERLLPWADVLLENYSPRVMPQFGLSEKRLHQLNPRLIYATMPGYGRSGPAENWLAYGSSVDSHAGLSYLTGYADRVPWKGGIAWPDPIAGIHALSGLLIALWDRDASRDGAGQTVETAMFEATVAVVGDQLLAHQQANDESAKGLGNRDHELAPQGVYACRGDDRWLAVSVLDDEGWRGLCELVVLPPQWAAYTRAQRHEHHDAIDGALADWTAGRDANEAAADLQACGIAAGPVHDAAGLMADPHLAQRDVFATIEQPEFGSFSTANLPLRLSRTPARIRRRAPLLGEDNHEILTKLGGLSADEVAGLTEAGVIADNPPA